VIIILPLIIHLIWLIHTLVGRGETWLRLSGRGLTRLLMVLGLCGLMRGSRWRVLDVEPIRN
jgi:hypothetical protein